MGLSLRAWSHREEPQTSTGRWNGPQAQAASVRFPPPGRWLWSSQGSAGSQRISGTVRETTKHACAAAFSAAVVAHAHTQVKGRQQYRGRMTQEISALLIYYSALREVH